MTHRPATGRLAGSPGRVALVAVASVVAALSCKENLPSGPNTFAAQLAIVVPRDTLVVGDSTVALAQATDAAGHVILGLTFNWTATDTAVVGFASPDTSAGRRRSMVGRRAGRSLVTVSLPDARFVVPPATKTATVVVGGVGVRSSRDTTLTALNDTGVAVATALVRSAGALVPRTMQGIRWTHVGLRTAVFGQGDTLRYIARSNGADTLIASHDFCLALAKCADTVIVRVGQTLTLSLSQQAFRAWSFRDSVGPVVRLVDRRGNGLFGSSLRYVPATLADSLIVGVSAPLGLADPTTGLMAAPRMVAIGNGSAKVRVLGIGTDGVSVVATDSVTAIVRQVARRVAVEPLSAVVTADASIPVRPVARDARNIAIADAPVTASATNLVLSGNVAGPTPLAPGVAAAIGTITPAITGTVALPESNPLAPQIPITVNQSVITVLKVDTATAGTTARTVNATVIDSTGLPPVGQLLRFGASYGPFPNPAVVQADGSIATVWVPYDTAALYTLTGVLGEPAELTTAADSAGRVVVRRIVLIKPDVPSPLKSTVAISATTIVNGGTATVTVTVKDKFGNIVKTAVPADFALSASGAGGGGTFGAVACTLGVCTVTYTAPAVAGAAMIAVKITALDILLSPLALTIT